MKKPLVVLLDNVAKRLRDLKILIVEDDQSTRFVLKLFLSQIGFNINQSYAATNGVEGLKLFEQKKIDLIFTDINMPYMDGLEMLTEIRENSEFNSVPTIIVSSEPREKLVHDITDWGYGYVPKPFTIKALEHEILNLEAVKYGKYIQA